MVNCFWKTQYFYEAKLTPVLGFPIGFKARVERMNFSLLWLLYIAQCDHRVWNPNPNR